MSARDRREHPKPRGVENENEKKAFDLTIKL